MNSEHSGASESAKPYFPFVIAIAFALLGAALVAASGTPTPAPRGASSASPVSDNPDADPLLQPKRCPFRAHGAHLCN